jgi:hypothetical protein
VTSQTVAAKLPGLASNIKLVGRYTVQRELRRDRYTTVYLAFDPVLSRELVIKAVQLHPPEGQDRTAHERIEQAFMRQAQAAGRLHHPNIVTVFDAGHVNRIGYIALEKVEGKLLDELLTEGYKPGFLQAADTVARVADAVEFAHARAIPHGHLSPSRIYLQGPERTPKVTGFGGWIDSGMTGDFELHGTERMLPYFGDELSGEARRKDVRALGALLFLLLTGVRPDVKTLRAQGKSTESAILQLRPTAPLALAEVAEQALELGGARVFGTAAQVRNALTTFLWGHRGDMPLPSSATITGMPARLAVMPKQAAAITVATTTLAATPPAASSPTPRGWTKHVLAAGVGIAALVLLATIWSHFQLTTAQNAAGGPPAAVASSGLASASAATRVAAPPTVSASASVVGPTQSAAGGMQTPHEASGAAGVPESTARVAATAAAAARGIVAFAVAPWGSVYVNGDARGTTPPMTQLTLPTGRHTIEIRNGEQPPYIAHVDVTPERPQQIRYRFQ